MNINFTEVDNLDNLDNGDNFDVNGYQSNNYWETTNSKVEKNKKISYNDILNSLNLVVNKNGVLQYISAKQNGDNQEQQQPQYSQQKQTQYSQQKQSQYIQQTKVIKENPLDPQVKNSAIFNKYFKNYKDPNAEQVQEVKVPQTMEEYKKMVFEERIRRIRERNRIAQIKSTKLLYESNNGNIGNNNIRNNGNICASKNNLRMMKFG
jgi:type II secretory pathway pseudopilin PulG